MTALIIGNRIVPNTFLVNGCNETVIIGQTSYPHLLPYVTVHFVPKENGEYLGMSLIGKHKGSVVFCDNNVIERVWTKEDREKGIPLPVPQSSLCECPDHCCGEGGMSTECLALKYYLNLGYSVDIIGFPKASDKEKEFIDDSIRSGKVRNLNVYDFR